MQTVENSDRDMNRKIIAIVLSIVLVAECAGCGNILTAKVSKGGVAAQKVMAQGAAAQEFHSGVVTINYSSLSHSHKFYYDDLFFYGNNQVYNNSLAILTLGVELAAFSADEKKGYEDTMTEEADGYTARAKNIRDAYGALGFTGAKYYYYGTPLSDASDKAAYSFAHKSITDGKTTDTLVVVPIRGGGYGAEWASNFRIGKTGNSYGFDKAARKVLADLKTYLKSVKVKGKLKLWVTGYSRGAATANLLTHYINSEVAAGKFGAPLSTGNIYAYTFATPNCYYSEMGDATKVDDNIINVISSNDMVPRIPLMHWGFKKYGQVKVFPEYADKRVATEYKELTRRNLEVNNMASMWNGITDSMASVVPDRQTYYSEYQERVSANFRDEFSTSNGKLAVAFGQMLEIMLFKNPLASAMALGYSGAVVMGSGASGMQSVENMHYPEHYLSWLELGESDFATTYAHLPASGRRKYDGMHNSTFKSNYKRYRFYCPVDIEVSSPSGKVLVSIVNDEIIEDKLPCNVSGDEKSFYLLSNIEKYHIVLTGNDSGSMSYFVDEYNSDSECVRSVYFYSIPLQKGTVYQDDVSISINDPNEDYSITSGDVKSEKALDTLTDLSASFLVTVDRGFAEVSDAQEGEAVMIHADPGVGEKFVRWVADDPDVVFDDPTSPDTFVRMPGDDVKITAVME